MPTPASPAHPPSTLPTESGPRLAPSRPVPVDRTRRRQGRATVDVTRTAWNLAIHTALWDRLVVFDPSTRYYSRVAAEPEFEAWLLTWLPGQGTQWHDHGDSAGSFVVLRGRLSEQVATWTSRDVNPRPADAVTDLEVGEQRSFGRRHVHRVVNNGTEPAASLHVYAPGLTVMTTYVATDGALSTLALQREGVNW